MASLGFEELSINNQDGSTGSMGASDTAPYNDNGSLIIDKSCDTLTTLQCISRLSGIGEVPELSEVQPVPHLAFASMLVTDLLITVTGSLLEIDVIADPKYAGWSPGSTSLAGYAREITFWRREARGVEPTKQTWLRASPSPGHSKTFLLSRWEEIVMHGFGKDWTEKESYEQVRELIGLSDYTWLDPDEGFKIRHQISDLISQMPRGPVPSFENLTSISNIMYSNNTQGEFNYSGVDVILRLLEARMLTLLIERAQRSWYGGITPRIVLYMIAADLWAKNIDFKTVSGPSAAEASVEIWNQQLDGIVKFVKDMDWPFAEEVVDKASEWRARPPGFKRMPLPLWDWLNGLVLPGYMFPSVTIIALYCMSTSLQSSASRFGLRTHKACFGILYPKKSYWNVRSIVGKVLAPLSLSKKVLGQSMNCLASWVGPCPTDSFLVPPSSGLAVDITTIPPPLFTAQTESDEYAWRHAGPDRKRSEKDKWIEPEIPKTSTESVVLQNIYLPKSGPRKSEHEPLGIANIGCHFLLCMKEAKVAFTLLFNSIFLAAPPCRGTHRIDPLDAANYSFRTLELSDLTTGGSYTLSASEAIDVFSGKQPLVSQRKEAIQVINATGGGAAEVYARAWCSWVGSNAVIWKKDSKQCCFKCALMAAGNEGLATKTLIIY